MPLLDLRVADEGGGIEVAHYCCDDKGKPVFNSRALKRGKGKEYTEEEKAILQAYARSGAEQVYRWRKDIPVHYIGPETIYKELSPGRFSLLGALVRDFLQDFRRDDNLMQEGEGVVASHVGRSRKEIYDKAIAYMEQYVLATPLYKQFLADLQRVLREQLEITSEAFEIKFSPPAPDHFFEQLSFNVREDAGQPLLPVTHMGTGFISLFVVALLRALVDSDKGGRIFILEEPETYLHEHFQEYFYQVLCLLAQRNQVIYTTHSKKFVDPFSPRSIVRLSREPGGHTRLTAPGADLDAPDELAGYRLSNPADYAKYMRTLEPNIGNIAFASRVVIVEGPHDLLAYRTVLSTALELGLHNTSVVAAWGKDSVATLIDLCELLQIPCYVIHDSDLPDPPPASLTPAQKAQKTKNEAISKRVPADRLHRNVSNLEAVLGIDAKEKSAAAVFSRIQDITVPEAQSKYPQFLPDSLLKFLGLEPEVKLGVITGS